MQNDGSYSAWNASRTSSQIDITLVRDAVHAEYEKRIMVGAYCWVVLNTKVWPAVLVNMLIGLYSTQAEVRVEVVVDGHEHHEHHLVYIGDVIPWDNDIVRSHALYDLKTGCARDLTIKKAIENATIYTRGETMTMCKLTKITNRKRKR